MYRTARKECSVSNEEGLVIVERCVPCEAGETKEALRKDAVALQRGVL